MRQFKSPCTSPDFSTVHAWGENLSSQELKIQLKISAAPTSRETEFRAQFLTRYRDFINTTRFSSEF